MISKLSFQTLLLICFSMFVVWGCNNAQSFPTAIPSEIIQTQPIVTPSFTSTAVSTITPTFTPAPNYCPRETVPPNVLEASNEEDDSRLIAFMASRFTEGGYAGDDIFVMNLDGSNRVNITNSPSIDRYPTWSPDGKKVAFLSNRNYPGVDDECNDMISNECVFEVFVSNQNGANLRQIGQGWNWAPIWSPDNKKVAYSFFFPAPNTTPEPNGDRLYLANIYVVDADGSNEMNFTRKFQPGWFEDPVWSPDSKQLAFVNQNGIVVINVNGTGATEYKIPDVQSVLYWSKDNTYILFMNKNNQIIKSNLDFTEFQKLSVPFISSFNKVKFSPNGKWFAYEHSYSKLGTDFYCVQIRIANVETSQNYFVYDEKDIGTATGDYLTPVANALGIGSFEWLSNDKLLFTQSAYHDVFLEPINDLFIINSDGTGLRYITENVSSFSLQP